MRQYVSAEEKDLQHKLAYHAACVSQYTATAANMTAGKMKDRALANASWHAKQHERFSAIAANRGLAKVDSL